MENEGQWTEDAYTLKKMARNFYTALYFEENMHRVGTKKLVVPGFFSS